MLYMEAREAMDRLLEAYAALHDALRRMPGSYETRVSEGPHLPVLWNAVKKAADRLRQERSPFSKTVSQVYSKISSLKNMKNSLAHSKSQVHTNTVKEELEEQIFYVEQDLEKLGSIYQDMLAMAKQSDRLLNKTANALGGMGETR